MAELKHQIPVDATPDKVYAALTTQAGLKSRWTGDTKAEEKVGGKAEFAFDKRAIVFRTKIEKLEPDKSVVWTCHGDQPEWNGTTLTWDLEKNHNGTTVRFTHAGWKAVTEMFAICNSMQFKPGRIDVPAQELRRGQESGAALGRIARTTYMPDIQHSVQIVAKPEAIYPLWPGPMVFATGGQPTSPRRAAPSSWASSIGPLFTASGSRLKNHPPKWNGIVGPARSGQGHEFNSASRPATPELFDASRMWTGRPHPTTSFPATLPGAN